MKKLLLIRHAKAERQIGDMDDFDRALSADGIEQATRMGARLATEGYVPQYILSSPALRTKTTAGIIAKSLNLAEPSYNSDIYEASYLTLLNIFNKLPDAYDFVVMVGHNPGFSQTFYNLTGAVEDMPTCAAALITFDFDTWEMVSAETGSLTWFGTPDDPDQ